MGLRVLDLVVLEERDGVRVGVWLRELESEPVGEADTLILDVVLGDKERVSGGVGVGDSDDDSV